MREVAPPAGLVLQRRERQNFSFKYFQGHALVRKISLKGSGNLGLEARRVKIMREVAPPVGLVLQRGERRDAREDSASRPPETQRAPLGTEMS